MHPDAALEHALAEERRRIVADIRDGFEASLRNLLSYVKAGCADACGIEQRITAALEELRGGEPAGSAPPARSALTVREIEVLSALAHGCTYARIAERLGISLGTVTSHIKNSYRKLTVHSAAAAVARAVELRLLRPATGKAEPR